MEQLKDGVADFLTTDCGQGSQLKHRNRMLGNDHACNFIGYFFAEIQYTALAERMKSSPSLMAGVAL